MSAKTAVKAILILIILSTIGASAYYVNKSRNLTNQILSTTNQESANIKPIKSKLPPLSVTDNWTIYSNQEGSFSLKYPSNWVIATNSKTCPTGTFDRSVYLGPDKNSIIKCPNNLIAQVYVTSLLGDQLSKYKFSGPGFTNVKSESVLISKQKGIKTTANTLESIYPKNSFIERYLVYNGTNTYLAQYIRYPSGPNYTKNVQLDFDSIATRTLSFQ